MVKISSILLALLINIGCEGYLVYPKCNTTYFEVSSTVPQHFVDDIEDAMKKWNTFLNFKAFGISKYNSLETFKEDRINTIYWNEADEDPGREALTKIYYVGKRILEADITINARNFKYFDEPYSKCKVHFESLMLHELGHSLGFKHFGGVRVIMHESLPPGLIRTDLSTIDRNLMWCRP